MIASKQASNDTRLSGRKHLISEEPLFFLYCALGIGILLLLIRVFFHFDLYRDTAAVYAPMIRSFLHGDYHEAFHPGIPCLNVLLSLPFSFLGLAPETSLGLVSSAFYVGTIPFVYLLLQLFLPKRLASFGSLLFACAPKIIRFSCSPVIDSGKLFFIVAALYVLIRFIRSGYRSWKYALLFACMLGGMSLARSEGFGNAGVLGGCLGLYWIADSLRNRKIRPVLPLVLILFPFVCCILLRVWINWHFCGVPVFDTRVSDGLAKIFSTAPVSAPQISVSDSLRISWLNLLNQNIRGCYELYLAFSAAGLLLILFHTKSWCRKLWPDAVQPYFVKWNRYYWIFLAVPLTNAIIFKASDIAAYRYFLLNIPCFMVFLMVGAFFLWKWAIRFVPRFLLAAAVAVLLICQIRNGVSNIFSGKSWKQYTTGLQIGEMLASEKNTAKIWFRTASIEWYYSGMKRAVPIEKPAPDPAVFSDFDYALWYDDQDGFEVLKNRKDLREIPIPGTDEVRLFQKVQNGK